MSMNFKMAWRNIWRNTRRSVITISAIVFASGLLVFMLSWQIGSYLSMIDSSVEISTGHLQVQAKGYHDQEKMWQVVADPGAVQALLEKTPHVKASSPRANAFSIVSSEDNTYGVLVVGIDPATAGEVSNMERIIRKGSFLSGDRANEALVGSMLAKNLQVDVGDELTILGQGRDGSIAATVTTVKGIYTSGQSDFDRGTLHMPLGAFREVYSMRGAVHEVVVVCDHLDNVDRVREVVQAGLGKIPQGDVDVPLVVLDWEQLIPGLIQMIQLDFYGGLILYAILVVVVAFSILNTFLMSVFERTREFGVLMALGTTPGRITRLLLTESMIMTVVGVLVGLLLGGLITCYYQVHGISMGSSQEFAAQFGLSTEMNPQLTWVTALAGPLAVLVVTFLIALYPALRIRRLRPVEAMRYI